MHLWLDRRVIVATTVIERRAHGVAARAERGASARRWSSTTRTRPTPPPASRRSSRARAPTRSACQEAGCGCRRRHPPRVAPWLAAAADAQDLTDGPTVFGRAYANVVASMPARAAPRDAPDGQGALHLPQGRGDPARGRGRRARRQRGRRRGADADIEFVPPLADARFLASRARARRRDHPPLRRAVAGRLPARRRRGRVLSRRATSSRRTAASAAARHGLLGRSRSAAAPPRRRSRSRAEPSYYADAVRGAVALPQRHPAYDRVLFPDGGDGGRRLPPAARGGGGPPRALVEAPRGGVGAGGRRAAAAASKDALAEAAAAALLPPIEGAAAAGGKRGRARPLVAAFARAGRRAVVEGRYAPAPRPGPPRARRRRRAPPARAPPARGATRCRPAALARGDRRALPRRPRPRAPVPRRDAADVAVPPLRVRAARQGRRGQARLARGGRPAPSRGRAPPYGLRRDAAVARRPQGGADSHPFDAGRVKSTSLPPRRRAPGPAAGRGRRRPRARGGADLLRPPRHVRRAGRLTPSPSSAAARSTLDAADRPPGRAEPAPGSRARSAFQRRCSSAARRLLDGDARGHKPGDCLRRRALGAARSVSSVRSAGRRARALRTPGIRAQHRSARRRRRGGVPGPREGPLMAAPAPAPPPPPPPLEEVRRWLAAAARRARATAALLVDASEAPWPSSRGPTARRSRTKAAGRTAADGRAARLRGLGVRRARAAAVLDARPRRSPQEALAGPPRRRPLGHSLDARARAMVDAHAAPRFRRSRRTTCKSSPRRSGRSAGSAPRPRARRRENASLDSPCGGQVVRPNSTPPTWFHAETATRAWPARTSTALRRLYVARYNKVRRRHAPPPTRECRRGGAATAPTGGATGGALRRRRARRSGEAASPCALRTRGWLLLAAFDRLAAACAPISARRAAEEAIHGPSSSRARRGHAEARAAAAAAEALRVVTAHASGEQELGAL